MSDKVFAGDYTDIKFIKSRKVAQVFIEIPLERANDFIAAFGTPNPATGVPVALARIDPNAGKHAETKPAKEKRDWQSMPPTQQAGIRCSEPMFQAFIQERYHFTEAAAGVRAICKVETRADLKPGTISADVWKQLDDEYWIWLHERRAA
jgi:hypothetical protein